MQRQKKVIRVDKVMQKHIFQNVRNPFDEKKNEKHVFRNDDKPNIKWFDNKFNINFPTSNHLHQPFHIRRAPIPSIGVPWPKPQKIRSSSDSLYRIKTLSAKTNLTKCDLLSKAVKRYRDIFFTCHNEHFINNLLNVHNANFTFPIQKPSLEYLMSQPDISRLYLLVMTCPSYPTISSDESYTLKTSSKGIQIKANEVWGAIRGLETLSQLIICINNTLIIKRTEITDYPRFPHRGILIDSARHFMSKTTMYQMLSAMEMNKMNVLHWHLTDDQSFPFESQTFPDLSGKGSYHPSLTYTPEDVRDIIEFARVRGIRIIPEFDVPGHSFSWGYGHPELLTQCFDNRGPISGHFGPMNPAKNNTYTFLSKFFKEILKVFKDQYIHLGNDEVPLACWNSNQEVRQFMSKINHISNFKNEGTAAWNFFTERLIQSIKNVSTQRENGVKFILWQEAFQSNLNIPGDAIVQVWLGPQSLVEEVTRRGYHAIVSSCWYINMIKYGVVWPEYYLCDPVSYSFRGDKSLVLGGEACLWSEFITSETAVGVLWPKASAVAERLWSDQSLRDVNEAAPRLEEQRCRMLRRGLPVGDVSGPGFCNVKATANPTFHNDNMKGQKLKSRSSANIQSVYYVSACLLLVGMFLFTFFLQKFKTKMKSGCFDTLPRLMGR